MVTDSTGAVIPKAKVTVHNEGTGVDKAVITTSTGNWTVPFLAPGVYDALTALIAEQSGFEAVYLSGASIAYTLLGQTRFGAVDWRPKSEGGP